MTPSRRDFIRQLGAASVALGASGSLTGCIPVRRARYVRLVAPGVDPLPEWHPGAGRPGWIFVDEIIVDE